MELAKSGTGALERTNCCDDPPPPRESDPAALVALKFVADRGEKLGADCLEEVAVYAADLIADLGGDDTGADPEEAGSDLDDLPDLEEDNVD